MRFMMLMIPGVYQGPKAKALSADFAPTAEDAKEMSAYNEELAKSGALLSLDGLHPLTKGARVSFAGGKPKVTDGPFIEAREVLGGFWMIQVGSKEEAIEWARRVPAREDDVIELRQVFEMEDFPADVQKAAESASVTAQVEQHRNGPRCGSFVSRTPRVAAHSFLPLPTPIGDRARRRSCPRLCRILWSHLQPAPGRYPRAAM